MTETTGANVHRKPLFQWPWLAALALILLNGYVCRELWLMEYSVYMGSIEGAYIGIGEYLLHHGLHLNWFPLWYEGISFQNTYPPLLHAIVGLTARVSRFSAARSYHVVTAAFYCLGPIAVHFLAARLSAKAEIGFAALLYSLYTPSAFLVPSMGGWLNSVWDPARLYSMVKFGDGPHVASVGLVALAIGILDWGVAKPSLPRVFATALAFAAVVLTNWLGAFALALAVASYLLAKAIADPPQDRPMFHALAAAALAYALACRGFLPQTLRASATTPRT